MSEKGKYPVALTAPDGNVVCEAGFFEERLVAATVDLDAANRAMALRSVSDETIVRDWMRDGVRLVASDGSVRGRAKSPRPS